MGPGPSGSVPTRPARCPAAIPDGGIVAVTVVAQVGLFVMGREPARHPETSRRIRSAIAGGLCRITAEVTTMSKDRSANGKRSPRLRINATSRSASQEVDAPDPVGSG